MKSNTIIFIRNNSSKFLAGISIIGVGVTAVLVAKGQMKADQIIAESSSYILPEAEEVNGDDDPVELEFVPPELTAKEYFEATWKCYIPGVVAGTLTIVAIIGAQYISAKQIAALSASVAMFVKNRDQLEQAIRDKYGEEALQKLKQTMSLRSPEKEYIQIYAEETGKGKLLCYEGYSGRWFRSEEDDVVEAITEFSDRYKHGKNLCFNDLYELLGIESTHFGWQYGFPDPETSGCCTSREEGIPMYVTRIYNPDYKEDVLYIDLGYEDKQYLNPVYPVDGWYEY